MSFTRFFFFPFVSMSSMKGRCYGCHLKIPTSPFLRWPLYNAGAGQRAVGEVMGREGRRETGLGVRDGRVEASPQSTTALGFPWPPIAYPCNKRTPAFEDITVQPNLCPSHFQYMIHHPFQIVKSGQVTVFNTASGEMFKHVHLFWH